MSYLVKPLIAELGSIKEQLYKFPLEWIERTNGSRSLERMSSRETGALRERSGGAAAKSANKTRTETNQEASDVVDSVSESQAGGKKRRRRPAEGKAAA
jgi:hypothetical protein